MNATIEAMTEGAMVLWDPKPTPHQRLMDEFEPINLSDYVPPPYSVGESLKRAMADHGRGHRAELLEGMENKSNMAFEVKRHEKAEEDGYELIAVERCKEANRYRQLYGAKVSINGDEKIETTSHQRYVAPYELLAAYRENRKTISATAIGKMLVGMVKELHGTCVREIGGVYYLTSGTCETFDAIIKAVEAAGGTEITIVGIDKMNPSTMRAIGKAITAELTAAASAVLEEVLGGELGERALENRQSTMQTHRDKCREYEQILNAPLIAVRKAIEDAETTIAAAKMLAVAQAEA